MRALTVILFAWTNPKKGIAKKRVLQRDAFEGETYYEAIPTTAILVAILWSAGLLDRNVDYERESPIFLLIGYDQSFFSVTLASSFFTSAFGLSKVLKTGPCKILPGTSLFSGRFFFIICVNFFNLLGKVYCVYCTLLASQNIIISVLASLSPGLIIALVAARHSKMLNTFSKYPSFFIVPVFSPVTFVSSRKTCCGESEEDGHIRFSINASVYNALASFAVSFVSVCFSSMDIFLYAYFPFLVLLFNLVFLANVRPTLKKNSCFCCCFLFSWKPSIEYGIFKPDQPTRHFVLCIDEDGTEEVCPEVDHEEQVEETETKEQKENQPNEERAQHQNQADEREEKGEKQEIRREDQEEVQERVYEEQQEPLEGQDKDE